MEKPLKTNNALCVITKVTFLEHYIFALTYLGFFISSNYTMYLCSKIMVGTHSMFWFFSELKPCLDREHKVKYKICPLHCSTEELFQINLVSFK